MSFNLTKRQFLRGGFGVAAASLLLPEEAHARTARGAGNRADLVFEVGRRTEPFVALNENQPRVIASMTKLATDFAYRKQIEEGHLDPSGPFSVKAPAFIRDRVIRYSRHINNALAEQVMMAWSANNFAYSFAAMMSRLPAYEEIHAQANIRRGTEEGFCKLVLNPMLQDMGMNKTTLYNSHGLPVDQSGGRGDLENISTLSDWAILCEAYVENHKSDLSEVFLPKVRLPGVGSFYNTNHLMENAARRSDKPYEGVRGLKTGMTNWAGFCTSINAVQKDDQGEPIELLVITTGHPTALSRDNHSRKLLDHGFEAARLRHTYEAHLADRRRPDYQEIQNHWGTPEYHIPA